MNEYHIKERRESKQTVYWMSESYRTGASTFLIVEIIKGIDGSNFSFN